MAEVVAARLGGATLIQFDTPGVGLTTAPRLSFRDRLRTLRGNLSAQTSLIVAGLQETCPNTQQVDLWGYSLGAYTVSAVAMSAEFEKRGFSVGSVSLIEAANGQSRRLLPLFVAMGKEDKAATDRYLRETHALGFAVTAYDRDPDDPSKKLPGRQLPVRFDSLIVGAALRKGFAGDVAKSGVFDGIPTVMYRANASTIARADENMETAEVLGARLVELRPPEGDDPHRHPFWLSMGAAGMLASAIAEYRSRG